MSVAFGWILLLACSAIPLFESKIAMIDPKKHQRRKEIPPMTHIDGLLLVTWLANLFLHLLK